MRMKRLLTIAIIALFTLNAENLLAQSGDEILKRTDEAINAPRDRTVKEQMTLIKADGTKKRRTIMFYQKGSDKILILFLLPADVKGVGFLSLSEDRMYLYMPAFRKIRRIASHIKNENFMGTDFSYEDMAETEYTDDYSAKIDKESAGTYTLELTPLPNADVSYSKLKMEVDKKTFLPLKIEFYSKRGRLIKRQTSMDLKKVDNYWIVGQVTMETIKTAHRTVLDLVEIKHDSGLSDRFFTTRNLKKLAR